MEPAWSGQVLVIVPTYNERENIERIIRSIVSVLNNKKITLGKGDFSRSISISFDEKLALLGTDNYLYLFDKNAKEKWKVPIPASIYSVNIAMDKK